MTPRRALFDPLQSIDKPSWLVVRNMTGAILDAEEIPPGADLAAIRRRNARMARRRMGGR